MTKQEILDKIAISESKLNITVADQDIFDELQALATVIIPSDKAESGDVVLVSLQEDNEKKNISFVVGKGYYPKYEQAVLGLKRGDTVLVDGGSVLIAKISRIVVPPVSDPAVRSIQIPGVNTVSAFKLHYLTVHEAEIKNRAIDQLYTAIVKQVVKIVDPFVSEESVDKAFADEKQGYLDYCEGDENAYIEELENEFEEGSLSKNEAALREQCRENAKQAAVGKRFAEEDGKTELDGGDFGEYLHECINAYFVPKINLKVED